MRCLVSGHFKQFTPRDIIAPVAILLAAQCVLTSVSAIADTEYYSSIELTNKSIPIWNSTNTIPLSPDRAVNAAIAYANSSQLPASWDIDEVRLTKYSSESSWFYTISLVDRKSGVYKAKLVRVLMNGQIWKPIRSK